MMLKRLPAIIILALFQTALFADDFTPFTGKSGEVAEKDLIPSFDDSKNRSNEFYNEWYSFIFRLKDGYFAYVQFLISNLGLGDGNAAVIADLELPDGRKFKYKKEFPLGKWEYSKDSFSLKFGENTVKWQGKGVAINLKTDDYEASYEFTNAAASFKPGNGTVYYGSGKKNYYSVQIPLPYAKITGKIKVNGEDSGREVKGHGLFDHSVTNQGLHEQARRWIRFRSLDSKATLLFTELHTAERYEGKKANFFVFYKGGKKFFDSIAVELKPVKFKVDEFSKHKYKIPMEIEVSGAEEGVALKGKIIVKKITGREDYLETLGGVKKMIVSKFAQPVQYYLKASYELEFQGKDGVETFKGTGDLYFTQVHE